MKTIAPAELDQLLRTQPDLPLLDVRTPMEYAQAHVPQARNIPLDTLAPRALFDAGALPQGQPVYILCQTGGRAGKAAERFAREGFDQAVIVTGGTQAWSEAGLPVDRALVETISLERQVRIAAGSLVLLGALLGYLVHPYFIGLSAFVGAGLVFAGITDTCGMGLLLAKAPWNRIPSRH
jgi:rhodanese-related sulfurtransferase